MPEEALRIPIELKNTRFVRTMRCDEFAKFLLETEPGSYRPDPELGCRRPEFAPDYAGDLRTDVRNHVIDQFRRYMRVMVNVAISEVVTSPTASFTVRVSGTSPNSQRFDLTWEV